MPTLERDGASIYYEVTGDGPPVVLGHSLLCDASMWRGVAPALATRYRVINVEVRGHHRSTAPRGFTLEDLAGDWLAILDHEQVGRAALVGLSMGGMTAMRLALAAPQRVAAMALIDSNGDREDAIKRARYAVMAAIYRGFGMVKAIEPKVLDIMLGRTSRQRDPKLVDEVRAIVATHKKAQLSRAIRAVNGRGTILDRLGAIACPTLVVVGDEDQATPVEKSERLASAIPGARLEIVPELGHLSALEDPAAILGKIEPFLASHSW
jgi:pimeloyl-ACP methyl ester carboxylesterase